MVDNRRSPIDVFWDAYYTVAHWKSDDWEVFALIGKAVTTFLPILAAKIA